MTRPCPSCGAACATEARFCRLCGTPLRPYASGDMPVSPGARTVPLTDEGRTTNGLSSEDGAASAPETARVRRAEMESILRRQAPTPSSLPEPPATQSSFIEKEAAAAPSTTSLAGAAQDGKGAPVSSTIQDTPAANGTHAAEASAVKSDENLRRGPEIPARAGKGASGKWLVIATALIVLVLGAVALALYYSGRTGARNAQGTEGPGGGDARRTVEERLAEAESLLASGKVTEAMARLRSIIRAEPANARAHKLLAEALERTGAVNEAIDEYRLAAQHDPGNEETLLRYADALRRVGRMDEARDIYQKLSSSSSPEVSRAAKEQLAALSSTASVPDTEPSRTDDARTENRSETNGANTTNGAAAQAPDSSSTRAGAPSAATGGGGDAAARPRPKNDPVASYATAMKIIEGKDIRKMNRAELIRAYELFQYAQSGPNAADATRRLQALDRELFERRKRRQ